MGSEQEAIRLTGRILYLADDPAVLRAQLEGVDLEKPPSLRDEISTDEITPAYTMYQYGEALGDHAYVGLHCGTETPIGRGDVKAGGFVASVSGRRRGKGSSREHAPFAELSAGIRVVFAESFEHLYAQNCRNLGLLISTDFDLLERIRRGDPIPLHEFTKDADPITRRVIASGGLFKFNQARLAGRESLPAPEAPRRPMTMGEKILASHWVNHAPRETIGVGSLKPGDTGFVRADLRSSHDYITAMAATFLRKFVGNDARVRDPASAVLFRDHLVFVDEALTEQRKKLGLLDAARALKSEQEEFARSQGIRLHDQLQDRKGAEGISHNLLVEQYVLPGQLMVSADSHAPHVGAVGCFGIGVGTTALANAWLTGDVQIVVPESVQVILRGAPAANVAAKDVMLALLSRADVRQGVAAGCIVEFCGDYVDSLGVDERATLTNMAVELGAFTGLVRPDRRVAEYLGARRGMAPASLEPRLDELQADPGASYKHTIAIDVDGLVPMVALPGDPGHGVRVADMTEDVKIDIAFGGSCTASKQEDMDMYAEVFAHGLARGKRIPDDVRCWLQFGSVAVREYCRERGHIAVFEQAGVRLLEPGCGACCNAGPGVSFSKEEVTVSSINRNYPGRSGPGSVYLASPYTVAASALAGMLVAYDPA